jgi:hypothetical protein
MQNDKLNTLTGGEKKAQKKDKMTSVSALSCSFGDLG